MDTTIFLYTGIGAASLLFAFIDYKTSLKRRMKLKKTKPSEKR